jgi:C4-dicarboxylate-specific signal transduction histidine kinase
LSWTAVVDEGRAYAVARDVTDLKNADEQLRASRHELAQVSRQTTMGAMTASIAHEVNQPRNVVSALVALAGLRSTATRSKIGGSFCLTAGTLCPSNQEIR